MNDSGLISLFLVSFVAATIFPAQSELLLAGLKASGEYNIILLFGVATVGNVLGSVVNWLLGRYLMHFKDRKWFPVKERAINKAAAIYEKYGIWTLLFAWVPFIGDPLTLVAGIFKTNIWLFIALVSIGKGLRYMAVLAVF